jgi:hypothetical protein
MHCEPAHTMRDPAVSSMCSGLLSDGVTGLLDMIQVKILLPAGISVERGECSYMLSG